MHRGEFLMPDGHTTPTADADVGTAQTSGYTVGERPEPQAKPRLGFTVAEVAEILDLHVNTVRDWIKIGKIEARQFGRAYYVPRAALYALLDDLELAS